MLYNNINRSTCKITEVATVVAASIIDTETTTAISEPTITIEAVAASTIAVETTIPKA